MWILLGLALQSPRPAAGETGADPETFPPPSEDSTFEVVEADELDVPRDELDLWVPALQLGSGALFTDSTGVAQSAILSGSNPPELIRPTAEGSKTLINPYFGFALELSTPALMDGMGRPRIFAHGDVLINFGFGQDIAREGSPGEMVDPVIIGFAETGIVGQGSTSSAQQSMPVVQAGIGVAFSFDDWLDRRWRIKPSFEFIREQYDLEGRVNRAVRLTVGSINPPIPATFQFIQIYGATEQVFYGLGGGLEVEVDVGRAGPMLLSVGVLGRLYRTIGERQVFYEGLDETRTESASFQFTKGPWSVQAGVGLRFRWAPE